MGNKGIDKSIVLEYKKSCVTSMPQKSVNSILSSLNALFMYMNWYELKVKTLKIQRQIFADKEKRTYKGRI